MVKKINILSTMTLAAFTTFLAVFILSLCMIRSADRIDACELNTPRSVANTLADDKLRSVEAIRIAFADRSWCPPRVAVQ